jgi:hypothetical protein
MPTETTHANPYTVLGVARDVDDDGLRRAYRAAVKRCHPDHGGDPAEFISVQEAYEALSDPQGRAAIDDELDRPGEPRPGGPTGAASASARPGGGQQRNTRARRPGPDARSTVSSWMEARCLFECDIRGVGLDVLEQRHRLAATAVGALRRNGTWDDVYAQTLIAWRERVGEIRAEVLAEAAPSELGPRLLRGPKNRGLFTDRLLALVATALIAVVVGIATVVADPSLAAAPAASAALGAVAVAAAALWWVPTWVASWVRLGWGRRAPRAAIASAVAAALLGAPMWGAPLAWASSGAVVTVVAALIGFTADRRLATHFPPPIWGPQRRLRALRERLVSLRESRSARRGPDTTA